MKRSCPGCPLEGATKVPSGGLRSHPKIAFVAEAPGETEQKEGKPLVGKSGQLLRSIIRDLGLDDQQCFYTNVCMCKPPGNKTPTQDMVNECYDGLMDELDEVQPEFIVTLGAVSAKAVGQYTRGVTFIRGQYRELELANGKRVGILPTIHPAAVLRKPDMFRSLSADLERAVGIAVRGEPPYIPPPTQNYLVVETQRQLDELFPVLEHAKILAIDLETISRDVFAGKILDVGFSWAREQGAAIDWELTQHRQNRARFKKVIDTVPLSAQTSSFELPWLMHRGYDPRMVFDTEIGHWLLDERGPKEAGRHDLDSMATEFYRAPQYKQRFRKRFGIPAYVNDEKDFAEKWGKIPDRPRRIYNATDCDYTYRLTIDQRAELKRQGIMPLMKLLVACTKLYAELYLEGMCVDMDYVHTLDHKFEQLAAKSLRKIERLAPGVNVRSPKQLATLLFDELKLSPFGLPADNRAVPEDVISASIQEVEDPEAREYWQTARIALYEGAGTKEEGRGLRTRSTSTFMLYWLAQQHPLPRHIIRYKKYNKARRTYITNVVKHIWPDGRLRPDYKLDGTLHGRFKTSRPAIHNITAGAELYDMFTAPPGFAIVHADFSQADMRMMAFFSGDERLVAWLRGDPHTEVVKEIGKYTDKQIVQMPRDELKKRRMAAKMVNFGLPYGRSAANLAPQMGMSVKEAEEYIRAYWRRLPVLKQWMNNRVNELVASGQELTSPFGNKRRFPLILNASHLRECARLAVNFPVMASVNYLTALAHLRVVKHLRGMGIETKVYPHLHDSINVCVPEDRVDEVVPIIVDIMQHVPEYIGVDIDEVPFPVEVDASFHWGTQQHVFEKNKQIPYDLEVR